MVKTSEKKTKEHCVPGLKTIRSVFSGSTTSNSNANIHRKKSFPKLKPQLVAGLLVLILTTIGGLAGLILTQTNQDVRQQASSGTYSEGDVCCKFTNGSSSSYSYTNSSICAGNGSQVSDSFCGAGGSDTACGQTPRCDGNTAVQCVDGKESNNPCGGGFKCQAGICIEDNSGCQQAGCPYQWVCNNGSGQCEFAGQDGSCLNVGCAYQQGYQCNTSTGACEFVGTEDTDCTLAGNSCQSGYSCDQGSGTCIKDQVANDCRDDAQVCANKSGDWVCNESNGLCILESTQSEDPGTGGQETPVETEEIVVGVVGIQAGDACKCRDDLGSLYTCSNQLCCGDPRTSDIWKQRNQCSGVAQVETETVDCYVYDSLRDSCFRRTTSAEGCSGTYRFSGSNAAENCRAVGQTTASGLISCYTYNVSSNTCTATFVTNPAECNGSNQHVGDSASSQCASRMNRTQAEATVTITQEEFIEEYGTFECDGGSQPGSCQDRGTDTIQICDNGIWRNARGSECSAPVAVEAVVIVQEEAGVEIAEIEEKPVCEPATCSSQGLICGDDGQLTDINCNPNLETAEVTETEIDASALAQFGCNVFGLFGVDACSNLSSEPAFDPGSDYVCFAWKDCRACPKDRVGNEGCEQLSSPNACGTKCGAGEEPVSAQPVTLVEIISNGLSIIRNNINSFFEGVFTDLNEEQEGLSPLGELNQLDQQVPQLEDPAVSNLDDQVSIGEVVQSKQGVFNVNYNSTDTIQVNGRGTAYALLDEQGGQVVIGGQKVYLVDGVNFGVAGQNFDPVYNSSGDLLGVVGDFSVQDFYSTGSQADLKGGPWYDIVEFEKEAQVIGGQKVKVSNFDYVSNDGGTEDAYRTMISTEQNGVWRIVAMEYRNSNGSLISRYSYGGGELNNTLNIVDEARKNQELEL